MLHRTRKFVRLRARTVGGSPQASRQKAWRVTVTPFSRPSGETLGGWAPEKTCRVHGQDPG
jgi:hypothetical protein